MQHYNATLVPHFDTEDKNWTKNAVFIGFFLDFFSDLWYSTRVGRKGLSIQP